MLTWTQAAIAVGAVAAVIALAALITWLCDH